MLVLAIVAASVISSSALVAATTPVQPADTVLAAQTHHIGETLDYSLHGEMSQTIIGKDAFGRSIHQSSAPTSIKGHENISITGLSPNLVSLQRSGEVTATVTGARPETRPASGWTTVDLRGAVIQDRGKLGGLFLLPVSFLGEQAVNQGSALQLGDRWSAHLGTKLYGMLSRPELHYSVTGQRTVLGVNVYTIVADGDVKMKEPVLTALGEALGYATGTAHLSAHADYDRANRRLVSLQIELTDMLHYTGVNKHITGSVRDHQRYLVALDASSMVTGQHGTIGTDPAADTPQDLQTKP